MIVDGLDEKVFAARCPPSSRIILNPIASLLLGLKTASAMSGLLLAFFAQRDVWFTSASFFSFFVLTVGSRRRFQSRTSPSPRSLNNCSRSLRLRDKDRRGCSFCCCCWLVASAHFDRHAVGVSVLCHASVRFSFSTN